MLTKVRFRLPPSLGTCVFALAIVACDRGGDDEAPAAAKSEPAAQEKAEAKPGKKAVKTAKAKAKPAAKPAAKPPAAAKELIEYVPDGAKLVLVADPKALARSGVFAGSGAFLDKLGESKVGEVYAAAEACKLGADAWQSVLIAGSGESEADLIIAARATGIGKKVTLDCLAGRINALASSGKWTVSEDAGRVVFDVEGRDTRGIAATDDILLVHGKGYASAVTSILDGKGKSAAGGSLRAVLARVDRSKHVYFAGDAPAEMRNGPFTDVEQLWGTLDFSSGLALAVAFEYTDPAKATISADTMGMLVEMAKENATGLGVPAGVIASVKIAVKDKTISAQASASKADLEAIAAAVQKQL